MSMKNLLLQILYSFSICTDYAIHNDFRAVFNFGDSNSDTGNMAAGLAFWDPPPYGMTYFKKPSGRYSDGRLIIDFLMDAVNRPFLNAYLDAVGAPSFREGCNFAAAGATIQAAPMNALCPFSFNIQINQFFRFKDQVIDLLSRSKKLDNYLPADEYFQKGIYTFDIGQNDIAGGIVSNTLDIILQAIPMLLSEFEDGITSLYNQGARNFWIHNTGPLGCLAAYIARNGSDPSKLDEVGCVKTHNQAAEVYNLQLHDLCKKLRNQYPDANVTYVDIYAIKLNLITNYSQYGFEQPFMTCCGYGGPPLNYDRRVGCGATNIINGTIVKAEACNDSSKYVNWDGIHYTEAANQFVASEISSGKYSDPPFPDSMPFLLKLQD